VTRTEDRRQMAEDVEVLRRLLGRALAGTQMQACMSCHVQQVRFAPDGRALSNQAFAVEPSSLCPAIRALAFSPDGKTLAAQDSDGTVRVWDPATGKQLNKHISTAHGIGAPEGVYLKGYGVVYTVTLPPPPHAAKPQPAKAAVKPLSDWERVRKEVRGDKADAPAPAPAAPPSLTDLILQILARNGKHFGQLGAKERITVVVTFREPNAGVEQTSLTKAGLLALQVAGMPPMARGGAPMDPMGGGPMNPLGQFGKKQPPASARDYELAGDLHLKQGSAGEAVNAYTSALEALMDERGPASDAHRRTLYRKLAQGYLGLADRANPARRRDELIARAIKWLHQATEKAKADDPPAASARLPAKLIISATKALLDQVGSGKLTFEEFRRYAAVESVPALTLDRPAGGKAR
jgi:hypothetical protein